MSSFLKARLLCVQYHFAATQRQLLMEAILLSLLQDTKPVSCATTSPTSGSLYLMGQTQMGSGTVFPAASIPTQASSLVPFVFGYNRTYYSASLSLSLSLSLSRRSLAGVD